MSDSSDIQAEGAQLLSRVRVVLVRSSHPGNIGASARALHTMGLSRLVLVDPQRFPDEQASARAAGATQVLDQAVVCDRLDQAIADCGYVLATSARPRHLGDEPLQPDVAARELIAAAASTEVALVFGNERTGLENDEIELCHAHTMVPTNPDYRSLNLAAAVQIYAWEMRRQAIAPDPVSRKQGRSQFVAPTHRQVEDLYVHLERVLMATGFLDPDNPRLLMRRLRQLVGRARPDLNELNILRGILTSVESPKRRTRRPPPASR